MCQNTSRTYGTKIEYAFHQTLFPRAIKRLGTRLRKTMSLILFAVVHRIWGEGGGPDSEGRTDCLSFPLLHEADDWYCLWHSWASPCIRQLQGEACLQWVSYDCWALVYLFCRSYQAFYLLYTEDGFLKTFFEKTQSMTPEERAEYLEKDDVRINAIKTEIVCSLV